MELTDEQLEAIREAAKTVEYGSVTVHISETSKHLDLEIRKRVRIESEPQKNFRVLPAKKKAEGAVDPGLGLDAGKF
jgi:hypothetical protein